MLNVYERNGDWNLDNH